MKEREEVGCQVNGGERRWGCIGGTEVYKRTRRGYRGTYSMEYKVRLEGKRRDEAR